MKFNAFFKLLPLWFLLILALLLRLYKLNTPILDWHSFRQADTASVTREYVKNGINILVPKYHDLSNIQSGSANPEGYRMVEFPIVNAGLAWLIRTIPSLDLVVVSRFSSALISLVTVVALYYLGTAWSGKQVGFIAALVFATLPFAVFYSRAVLPEPYLLACSTSAIAFFYHWLKHSSWLAFITSFGLLTLSFLLKPFTVFLAPVFLAMIVVQKNRLNRKKIFGLLLMTLSILPTLAWRHWILNFPTGVPVSDWLYNGNGIRLRPAWFRWLFYERLTKLILGFVGVIFLPFGILKPSQKEIWLYLGWWAGIFVYLIIIATGNVQHDYYQNLLLPILSLSIARGMVVASRFLARKTLPVVSWSGVMLVYLLTVIGGWSQVSGFYNVNHWEYLTAGKAVDELLPKDALVIAPAMGDTQFLFQTNRRGWPIGFDIADKIERGATAYVTTSKDDEAKELKEHYSLVKETDQYLIIDLTKPKKI